MFFTYIILSIWMYSLERQKPQIVEISPVVNEEIVKPKPKKSEPLVQDSETVEEGDILESENNEGNIEPQETEDIEYYDPEIYEEITFQDDFDKEYRNDVGDSYFEDPEETISDTPEDSENVYDILE